MKKMVSLLLIGTMVLSMTACGGKKEEAKSGTESKKEIDASQTTLSNTPKEPAAAVGFTCKPEMYDATWEDGLFQLDDVVFDPKKDYTFGEIVELFSNTEYDITYTVRGGSENAYNSDAITTVGNQVALKIHDNKNITCLFYGIADSEGDSNNKTSVSQCSFTGGALSNKGSHPLWVAQGIHPFDLTYKYRGNHPIRPSYISR